MTERDKYDLRFLLAALRVEAHGMKKERPEYAVTLLRRLDEVKHIVE